MGEKADEISIIRESLRWVEENRHSKHRDLQHVLKGFLGDVEFEGDIAPFMPLLRLGEVLHVGKATAFGQGWYEMETRSQRAEVSIEEEGIRHGSKSTKQEVGDKQRSREPEIDQEKIRVNP